MKMSATRHGIPGEWAKVKGTVMSLWPLFVCFAALGAFAAAAVSGRFAGWFAGGFAVSVVFTAVFWRKGMRRVESYFKGARGEEHVASLLETLPSGWHIFHDFAAGGYHVDHVVVGPTGVYAVETKNWRGRVTHEENEILVDGTLPDRAPLAQTRREAEAVCETLKRAGWEGVVVPVLCMASDSCIEPQSEVRRVAVVNASIVVKWLAGRPCTLSANEVERLAQLMETYA